MNYRTFVEYMKEQVEGKLGKDYKVEIVTNQKLNGTEKTGLSISRTQELQQAVSVIYLEECFEKYVQDGKAKECVEQICEIYRNQKGNEEKIMEELGHIQNIENWEGIQDRVYPMLVSAKENENLQENFLYKEYLDFLVLYTIRITEIGIGSIKITKQMVKSWGISEEEVDQKAFENLKNDGYRVRGMSSVIKECILGNIEDIEEEEFAEDENAYVLTNEQRYLGAAGIFLCGEMFQKVVGESSFYILPSSVHELILIEDNGEIDEKMLREMVREVNEKEVSKEEKLSDEIYYFDTSIGKVELITEEC